MKSASGTFGAGSWVENGVNQQNVHEPGHHAGLHVGGKSFESIAGYARVITLENVHAGVKRHWQASEQTQPIGNMQLCSDIFLDDGTQWPLNVAIEGIQRPVINFIHLTPI